MGGVDADGNPLPPNVYNPGATGPTASGSDGLDFSPEAVSALAKSTLTTAQDLDPTTFKNLSLPKGLFWDFEGGADVVEAHEVAHQISTKTLRGIQEDLTNFSEYLTLAVKETTDVDDQVQALLLRLAEAPEGSAADDAYRDAHDGTDAPESWEEPSSDAEEPAPEG